MTRTLIPFKFGLIKSVDIDLDITQIVGSERETNLRHGNRSFDLELAILHHMDGKYCIKILCKQLYALK